MMGVNRGGLVDVDVARRWISNEMVRTMYS